MRISDFARESGLSIDTIRYYERIGLMPRVLRDRGGRRDYGIDDLVWASFLQKLQAMDMPMRKRLEYSRLRSMGTTTLGERRHMLEEHRATLLKKQTDIAGLIAALDAKITHYRDMEGMVDDPGSMHDHGGCGGTADPGRGRGTGA
ncbi:MerR family transcriptional regulator [Methylobacterium sp. E-045]|uniref:MerR family transcriptional regulator n=1 Tax=Methylobacterium sp. E-045 TaxID=2836575 RepID=UPI001FBACDAC|nr:MerR family transcriptional regulator [Methylobacterium sp. E-045]MCJ2131531.1 MerR family transcriptional regulator [Methylobacterium sp. E-045]